MYKIEKDIPAPLPNTKGVGKYPWREMKIGDSFFIPYADTNYSQVNSAPSYFSRRNPEYKFTVRKVEGGYRIWRIKVK